MADRDFPWKYRDLYREIKTVLREAPNDFELLCYLGQAEEIRRRSAAALRAYRQAEKGAVAEVRKWRKKRDAFLVQRASNILREIRERIRALD